MTVDIILGIVYTQLVLIPILGALYFAAKRERIRASKLGEIKPRPAETQAKEILSGISERVRETETNLKKYKALAPKRLGTDGDYGRKILERIRKKKD